MTNVYSRKVLQSDKKNPKTFKVMTFKPLDYFRAFSFSA